MHWFNVNKNKVNYFCKQFIKNKYTKKQIQEAIAYWRQVLNENENIEIIPSKIPLNTQLTTILSNPWLYVTQLNTCFTKPTRKIGCSRRDNVKESFFKKLNRYSTSTNEAWKAGYQLEFSSKTDIFKAEREFNDIILNNGGEKTASSGGGKELFYIDDDNIISAILELKTLYPDVVVYDYIRNGIWA